MSTIDRAKLDLFILNLDVKRAELRGLADAIADRRSVLDAELLGLINGANGRVLDSLWDRRDVRDLARLSAADLDQARIDRAGLAVALRDRDRLDQFRQRHDALAAEIAPLATLVARLTAYAEAHA